MKKIITVYSRVSGKHGDLIPNLKGSVLRRVQLQTLGNATKSISNNQNEVKLKNSAVKEVHSSLSCVEKSTLGAPIE